MSDKPAVPSQVKKLLSECGLLPPAWYVGPLAPMPSPPKRRKG